MKKMLAFLTAMVSVMSCTAFSVSAEENDILYGDANCDSNVNLVDLTCMNQHVVKIKQLSEQGIKNCDFFENGEIAIRNLTMFKGYMIGIRETFEPEKLQAYTQLTNKAGNIDDLFKNGAYFCARTPEEVPECLKTDEYDEDFFEENNIYYTYVCNGGDDDIKIDYVEVLEDGNYKLHLQYLGDVYRTELAIPYCVGFAVPKSIAGDAELVEVEENRWVICDNSIPNKNYVNKEVTEFGKFNLIENPNSVNVEAHNISNINGVYNTEIIESVEQLKEITNDTELLEKYNEEFFKESVVTFAKWVDYDGMWYIYLSMHHGTIGNNYANYLEMQVCEQSTMETDKLVTYCSAMEISREILGTEYVVLEDGTTDTNVNDIEVLIPTYFNLEFTEPVE